jgi:hypothetical protein
MLGKFNQSSKSSRRWLLHTIFFISSLCIPIVVAHIVIKLYVAWYMYKTGTLPADNSDNYGLAFEFTAAAIVSICVTFLVVIYFWWSMLRKKS